MLIFIIFIINYLVIILYVCIAFVRISINYWVLTFHSRTLFISNSMKIIFLDIDGVLNSGSYMNSMYMASKNNKVSCVIPRDKFGIKFDPRCCNYLSYLIRETNSEIVISSTWRLSGLGAMIDMWNKRGLDGNIHGITKVSKDRFRGDEIQSYIDKHEITKYVIINDDMDILQSQQPFFVKTSNEFGLSYAETMKAIEILNS